jgi:hypothetical protein
LQSDIFEFWSLINRGEHIHPADVAVLNRMTAEQHGFKLECLPGCYGGPLKTAPIVLLFLSPGFSAKDAAEAKTEEMRDYYVRRWAGDEPLRGADPAASAWVASRTRAFGDWDAIRINIAILNIGAYHSKDVKSYGSLMALPSSRVALDWAQSVLFPQAEAGKRLVICMRSAHCWGLERGRSYGAGLFAPHVNRSGYLINNDENARLVQLVRSRVTLPIAPTRAA